MSRLPKVSHRFRQVSVYMFWVMSRVPDDPLIRNGRQGGACRVVSRKVLDDCWVLDNPLLLDDLLIHNDRQGGACHVVLGKVLDNRWVLNDPLVLTIH